MLRIVVADTKEFRKQTLETIVGSLVGSEIIVLDDTVTTLTDLEQYIYPSLFSVSSPIVHVRFMLEGKIELDAALAKKLVASPTVFVFEELSLPATVTTLLKKYGALIDSPEKQKLGPKEKKEDIFAVTNALTSLNKKDRWLAYQSALEHHAVEAIVGILYWKIRDNIVKGKDAAKWRQYYTVLLAAHADAWQSGTPLTVAIEKVILTQ